jgi:hypothetical protein
VTDQHIIETYKSLGYDAIILTNHINWYWKEGYPKESYKAKVDFYLSRYNQLKTLADQNGIKVFLGAEVATITQSGVHQEFLIVGFDKEFLYSNDLVYTCTQPQLFELANKNGLFMWQSHPYRVGEECGDPKFMHGAEAFNSHYHHDNNNPKSTEFCNQNSLIKMSGSDYHHSDQPVFAGIIVPDDIQNEKQLANYLLNNQPLLIQDQERCIQERQKYIQER